MPTLKRKKNHIENNLPMVEVPKGRALMEGPSWIAMKGTIEAP